MKRLIAILPLVVLAALAVMFLVKTLNRQTQVTPDAIVGRPVPALTLPTLGSSQPVSLPAAAQGPVLINIFASWCTPCVYEHPQLEGLAARGVRIIGVAYKDRAPDTQVFLERHGNPFALVVSDFYGEAGVEFGITGVPETYLVDAAGKIVFKQAGPLTPQAAEEMFEKVKSAQRR